MTSVQKSSFYIHPQIPVIDDKVITLKKSAVTLGDLQAPNEELALLSNNKQWQMFQFSQILFDQK